METINRTKFLSQLELLQAGLSSRELLEQSSCFVFKDGVVHTFNDEVSCSIPTELASFTGAIVAAPLLAILRKMPEDQVTIEATASEIVVAGKNRKCGITAESEVLLPIDSVERPTKWKKLPDDFAASVKLAQSVVAKNEARFVFTCVHIHAAGIEGGDNSQFVRVSLNTGFREPVLVKGPSINSIVELGMTEFALTDAWVHFKNAVGLVLACRRYVESYPDLTPIMNVEGGSHIALPKGLDEAIDKASIFANDTADSGNVIVTVKPGKLLLKGAGAFGWYKEIKKVRYSGPCFTFMIAPAMLQQIVKSYNDCQITANRLYVQNGSVQYISSLRTPSETAKGE
jgi:hypothetical protein